MGKRFKSKWLLVMCVLSVLSAPLNTNATSTTNPAIVLAAFGTTAAAFDTYQYFELAVKKRFPGHEIRWAFTSRKVRHKVAQERGQKLNDLATTLRDLKAAGYTRVAIQSLHVVPGEEWEKKVVEESRKIPGLKVALGKPLLASQQDQERAIEALAHTFPKEFQHTALILVAHGSPSPEGTATYLAFDRLLRSHYPHRNIFLGTVEGKPSRPEVMAALKQSSATIVILRPFLFVAGEHVANDVLGDDPESWKSKLEQKSYQVQGINQGLGYQAGIVNIYLDHLAQALQEL